MKRNEIYTLGDEIVRILVIKDDNCLVIDCNKNNMPSWRPIKALSGHFIMTDEDFITLKQISLVPLLLKLINRKCFIQRA